MDIHSARIGEMRRLVGDELLAVYPATEAAAIAQALFTQLTGKSASELVMDKEHELTESELFFLQQALGRLLQMEPLQYITGTAWFHGYPFTVNPSVLIPRPETEELVSWITDELKRNGEKPRILDVGTGSGCIALTLYRNVPGCEIWALDVSDEALAVAQENANNQEAAIFFTRLDILHKPSWDRLPSFGLIVSNPPYVTPADREKMMVNVTGFEPHIALFVDGDDPLAFYREIILFSSSHLDFGGSLFFECNEGNSHTVAGLMEKHGFSNVALRKDMQGKARMLRGMWFND
jgi:release factor glutamine methyltransferase